MRKLRARSFKTIPGKYYAAYESFDHGTKADEHENGQIWSATLWDIWKATDRRAADRNLYRGRPEKSLKWIFRRRVIGPVE